MGGPSIEVQLRMANTVAATKRPNSTTMSAIVPSLLVPSLLVPSLLVPSLLVLLSVPLGVGGPLWSIRRKIGLGAAKCEPTGGERWCCAPLVRKRVLGHCRFQVGVDLVEERGG